LKEVTSFDRFTLNQRFVVTNSLGYKHQMSAIEMCAQNGAEKCFDFLLSNNPYFQRSFNSDGENWGAMDFAVLSANYHIFKALEERNEKITIETIRAACLMHENEFLQWILAKSTPSRFYRALKECVLSNNFEGLFILINAGANVNEKNSSGETVILEACKNGSYLMTKILISLGADLNTSKVYDGRSPLIHACANDYLDIIEMLVKNGANVNVDDDVGKNALIFSCCKGNIKAVNILIKAGAVLNSKTNIGWTPLMYASAKGANDIITLLVSKGAHLNEKEALF